MSSVWLRPPTSPEVWEYSNEIKSNLGQPNLPSGKKNASFSNSFSWKKLSEISADLDQASFDSCSEELFIRGQKIPLSEFVNRIYAEKMSLKTLAEAKDSFRRDKILEESLNQIEKENTRLYWNVAQKFQKLLNSRSICSLARISRLFRECCLKKDPFYTKEATILSDANLGENDLEYILFSDSDD